MDGGRKDHDRTWSYGERGGAPLSNEADGLLNKLIQNFFAFKTNPPQKLRADQHVPLLPKQSETPGTSSPKDDKSEVRIYNPADQVVRSPEVAKGMTPEMVPEMMPEMIPEMMPEMMPEVSAGSSQKSYQCNLCLKTFSVKPNLKRHYATVHLKKKPFTCEVCDKSFGHRNVLENHIRCVHKRIRPYSCDICGRSFGFKVVLEQHKKAIHYKEKKTGAK